MKKLHLASLDSANFSFKAFGETKEQARQTLIDGLHIHATQYKVDRNWWVDYGMNLEEVEAGTAYRDYEAIPKSLDSFDPKDMSFTHEGTAITNPTLSECGRFTVSPEEYGFSVENTGGGSTAWQKRVRNGWIVLSDAGCSHKLGAVGSPMLMGFYDNAEDGESMWGNAVAYADILVGIPTTTEDEIDDIADRAVNALALSIQNDLGVLDGDLASVYFSGDEVKAWATDYIKAELKARIDNAKAKAEK